MTYKIDTGLLATNYPLAMETILKYGKRMPSRVGDVFVLDAPVMTVTAHPTERVLLDPVRDANPFFHLFESVWMLAGENDATWLDKFVHDFSSRFAESNGKMHGAYGFRWRRHFHFDQIRHATGALKKDPYDRRVVIQMWDPTKDQGASVRDVPCNTEIFPRIVNGNLDLTVVCRSNDAVWGCYGSNVVHFSVLLEVMAGMIGCGVGKLYQLSNNLHIYEQFVNKFGQPVYHQMQPDALVSPDAGDYWIDDAEQFVFGDWEYEVYKNKFFPRTLVPMRRAHELWKSGRRAGALAQADTISCPQWRRACVEWISRRSK